MLGLLRLLLLHRKNNFFAPLFNYILILIFCLLLHTHRAVTLPTTIHCMNDKNKSDSRISNFVLTLGVNLQTNGTAIFFAIASMFIARLNGVNLEFGDLVVILFVSTTTSMSMPSVPSASMVMLIVVLSGVYKAKIKFSSSSSCLFTILLLFLHFSCRC